MTTQEYEQLGAVLAAYSAQYAHEKQANFGKVWPMLRGLFTGATKTVGKTPTTRYPYRPSPVRVVAGTGTGQQPLFIQQAGQTGKIPVKDFLAQWQKDRLVARTMVRQGLKPPEDVIKRLNTAGQLSENPTVYTSLPESVRKTVAGQIRGVISPRFQFGARVAQKAAPATGVPSVPTTTPPTATTRPPPPLPAVPYRAPVGIRQ